MRGLAMLAVIATVACSGNSEPEVGCTLIGCNDGLNVVVNSTLQQDFTVTVSAGGQTLHTFACRSGQACHAFIENQTPASVTVSVSTATGPVSKTYAPEYEISKPNGP